MIHGCFKIEVSDQAEILDYNALTDVQKTALFQSQVYDPKMHDIYRVLVAPVEVAPKPTWNARQIRKKSFPQVNRVLVRAETADPSILIFGQFPPSITANGQTEFDFEGEAQGAIVGLGKISLKIMGPVKNLVRSKAMQVWAYRTNRVASWIFAKTWIEKGGELKMEVLCVVDKSLEKSKRKLVCHVDFKQDGRSINARETVVALPVAV